MADFFHHLCYCSRNNGRNWRFYLLSINTTVMS